MEFTGPRYIQIDQPCTSIWGFPAERTMDIARLAVNTGLTPLFEMVEGQVTGVRKIKKQLPVEDYLKPQKRFAHLYQDRSERGLRRRAGADQGPGRGEHKPVQSTGRLTKELNEGEAVRPRCGPGTARAKSGVKLICGAIRELGGVSEKKFTAVGFVFRLRRCLSKKVLDVAQLRLRAFLAFRLAAEKHARPRHKIFPETPPKQKRRFLFGGLKKPGMVFSVGLVGGLKRFMAAGGGAPKSRAMDGPREERRKLICGAIREPNKNDDFCLAG